VEVEVEVEVEARRSGGSTSRRVGQ